MGLVLYDRERNRRLCEITEGELAELVRSLETEELSEDGGHREAIYLDGAVCEFLKGRIDDALLAKLRAALGLREPRPAEGESIVAADDDEELPPVDDADAGAPNSSGEDGVEIEWRRE